jgi:hypothetical protein
MKAHEEIIDFVAAGTTPNRVTTYQPSEAAKARAWQIFFIKRKPPA